jgi:HsdM N-terminal domain
MTDPGDAGHPASPATHRFFRRTTPQNPPALPLRCRERHVHRLRDPVTSAREATARTGVLGMGRIHAACLAYERSLLATNSAATREHPNRCGSVTHWCLALVCRPNPARLSPTSEALAVAGGTRWDFSGSVTARDGPPECRRRQIWVSILSYSPQLMLTGEIRSQIDQIWNAFWSGGISNPLEVIEQITYLLFLKRLDEQEIAEELKPIGKRSPVLIRPTANSAAMV